MLVIHLLPDSKSYNTSQSPKTGMPEVKGLGNVIGAHVANDSAGSMKLFVLRNGRRQGNAEEKSKVSHIKPQIDGMV